MTQILHAATLSSENFIEIAATLKNNGTMIYPTETIYGLGCRGDSQTSINKIFKIKKRSEEKGLILLFGDLNMLSKYVEISDNTEQNLIDRYWPGNLTLILRAKNSFQILGKTVACRISPHPFIKNLFNFVNFPIVSTSANISGEKYSGDILRITEIFKGQVDIIVNSGSMPDKSPSTIVKVENGKPVILRQGAISIFGERLTL